MNRVNAAGFVFVSLLMVSPPSLGQTRCEGGGQPTEASCGGDQCSCAGACSENSQCLTGCCNQGFCALKCVCDGEGTVTVNCELNGGCGTIAPAAQPLGGGTAMLWGFGLIGVGLMASARFLRRGGLRSPAAVAALSVALLGMAFVAATAFEKAPIDGTKGLAQR